MTTRAPLDKQVVLLERSASGALAANSLGTPRLRSNLVLCAVCIALAALCWIGLAVWLNQWTDEHNASLARACDVCEDHYGGIVPAAVGFFQDVIIVFGLCAIFWLLGYPHWYWRVPLLVMSLLVMIGGFIFLSFHIVLWPVLFVGAFGFVTSVKPVERVGPSAADLSN